MTDKNQEPTQVTPPTVEPIKKTDTEPNPKTGDKSGFSQDDVDRFTSKARKDGRKSAQRDLFEELGIEGLDEIKTMLADAKTKKEADMSESEKLTSALEKMTTERDTANTKLAEQMATLLQDKRNRFVRKALLAGGAKDKEVGDLLILVDSKMASDKSSLFEEGKSEAETSKLDPFVKQVQAQMGSYFGTAGAGSPAISGRNPSSEQSKEDATQAYMKRLRS